MDRKKCEISSCKMDAVNGFCERHHLSRKHRLYGFSNISNDHKLKDIRLGKYEEELFGKYQATKPKTTLTNRKCRKCGVTLTTDRYFHCLTHAIHSSEDDIYTIHR